jgi:hypothetical protein
MPAKSINQRIVPAAKVEQPADVAMALRSLRKSQRSSRGRYAHELVLPLARTAAKERLADAFDACAELAPGSRQQSRAAWLEKAQALLSRTGARFAVGLWVRQMILAERADENGCRSATYERVASWVVALAAEVQLDASVGGEHDRLLVEALASTAEVPRLWGKAITTHRGPVRVASVARLGYVASISASARSSSPPPEKATEY